MASHAFTQSLVHVHDAERVTNNAKQKEILHRLLEAGDSQAIDSECVVLG